MIYRQYLERYAFRSKLIDKVTEPRLSIIVVIPAHDEDTVVSTLNSLHQAEVTELKIEVMVVFNASEADENEVIERNEKAYREAKSWYSQLPKKKFQLHLIQENQLPKKHAGVGLARKIGMDEAIRRFEQNNQQDGLIFCFDADSKCEGNYFAAIHQHFNNHPKSSACSIHFEHPTAGEDFSHEVYEGIAYYELHLRYYKQGLAYAKLPFAFHTIGSSMAVRAVDYCKQGGMNRRKAGEDFYFLQKFIRNEALTEVAQTKVIPSPRPSHRVPFGTGRAVMEMQQQKRDIQVSYSWQAFEILKRNFAEVDQWYTEEPLLEPIWLEFIGKEEFDKKLSEIRKNSTSKAVFFKRLFQWFDAFQCLKFMHFVRDHYHANEPLIQTVNEYLQKRGEEKVSNVEEMLNKLRKIDLKED